MSHEEIYGRLRDLYKDIDEQERKTSKPLHVSTRDKGKKRKSLLDKLKNK